MTLWHLLAVTLDLLAIALVVIAGVTGAGHDETTEEPPGFVWYPAAATGSASYATWVGFTLSG